MAELDSEPALGDEGIQPHGGKKWVEPGVGMGPERGLPREGQTGSEDSQEMGFAGRTQKIPSVDGKGGGPFCMPCPDFLKSHNIYMGYNPSDDIPYWCAYPGKPVDIIRGDSYMTPH
jgi:hypothetical protein